MEVFKDNRTPQQFTFSRFFTFHPTLRTATVWTLGRSRQRRWFYLHVFFKLWQAALISFRAHGHTCSLTVALNHHVPCWTAAEVWKELAEMCNDVLATPLRQQLPCLLPDARAHGCSLSELTGPEDRQVVSGGESGKGVCIRNVPAQQSWAASNSLRRDTVFIIYTMSPWGTKLGLSTNRIQSTWLHRNQ